MNNPMSKQINESLGGAGNYKPSNMYGGAGNSGNGETKDKQTIGWEEEFDENFSEITTKSGNHLSISFVKSFIKSHFIEKSILDTITTEIEGKRKESMIFGRKLTEGGGHPDFAAIEYNKALSDVLIIIAKHKDIK